MFTFHPGCFFWKYVLQVRPGLLLVIFSLKPLFSISLPPSLHFHSFLFTLNPDCSLNNFFFECISDYLFWKLLLQFCPDLLLDSLSLKTIFPHVAFPLSPSSKLLFTFNPDCSWKLFSFAFIPDCILKICLYDFVLDCCVELIVENSSSVFSLPPLSLQFQSWGCQGLLSLLAWLLQLVNIELWFILFG